jgi:ABC-type transport system substrate-binding protein
MRRYLTIAVACAALFGCRTSHRGAASTSDPAGHRGGTLRVLSEPASVLDPAAIDEVYESVVVRQIYQGLLTFDPGLRILPCLATSWTISPDGTRYTFNLRHGVRFHDGSPLTARDAAFSLERCLTPGRGTQSLAATFLGPIRGARAYNEGHAASVEGIHVVDDQTLMIELERPCPVLLKVLAMDQTVIINRAAFEAGGEERLERSPIGTGPFRYVRRQVDGGITLARFDGYWGTPSALDTIVFKPLPTGDKGKEAEALANDEGQLSSLPTGTSAKARDLGLSVYRCPELSLTFLGLRLDAPPFDIPQVRRAVLLAIRREPIREIDPEGIIPVFGLLPPGMPGREPVDRMPQTDPAEARRLIAEAGYPEGRGLPTITIAISRGGEAVGRIAQGIQTDLRAVGLDVRLQEYAWRQLDSLTVNGRLQAFMLSWVADLPDPDAFLYPLFDSHGETNLFGYSSPEVDGLLAEGRVLPPGEKRSAIYAKLQDVIIRDAPLIPLYHSSIAYAWRPEVHDVEIGPSGLSMIDFDRIYVSPADLAHDSRRPSR